MKRPTGGAVAPPPLKSQGGTVGEYRCSFPLSLTSALGGGGWLAPGPAALPPEKLRAYCTEGWMGPRAGPDKCRKSPPPLRDSMPARS